MCVCAQKNLQIAKRTFGSLALHHCKPLKIIVVTILPDFVFDVFTFFLANFPAFNFRAFFVDKKAGHVLSFVCVLPKDYCIIKIGAMNLRQFFFQKFLTLARFLANFHAFNFRAFVVN